MDICEAVGKNVRAARQSRGWTQQMLADHAQLTREHICRIEDGSREMGLRTLERIGKALGVRLAVLLGEGRH